MHVVVARFRSYSPSEYGRNVATQLVHRRDDNMTWRLVVELLNAFAKVGFDHLNSTGLQKRPHLALVGQHGFAFDQRFGVVRGEDVIDGLIVLTGVARPMDVRPVLDRLSLELLEIISKMR